MPGVLIHETNHHIDVPTCFQEGLEHRIVIISAMSHARNEVLKHVTGQREVGKNNKIGLLGPGLTDQSKVLLQVGLNVPQLGCDLRQCKIYTHVKNLTTERCAALTAAAK